MVAPEVHAGGAERACEDGEQLIGFRANDFRVDREQLGSGDDIEPVDGFLCFLNDDLQLRDELRFGSRTAGSAIIGADRGGTFCQLMADDVRPPCRAGTDR